MTAEIVERNLSTDPIKIHEYGKGRCGEFAALYAGLCISIIPLQDCGQYFQ